LKTDAIIIGTELDGLIAAIRLREHGYSVRMIGNGGGSLHYAPEGIHVLGFSPRSDEEIICEPLELISQLDQSHPYRKVGIDQIRNALDWFVNISGEIHQKITISGHNELAVSATGLSIPVYGTSEHQATVGKIGGKTAALVRFRGYRDFPVELVAIELGKTGTKTEIVDVVAPGDAVENAALAKSFDELEETDSYFTALKGSIPSYADVMLFPAVMGLSNFHRTLASAERVLGMPCLEVPTLPPSVPGMRLERALTNHLRNGTASLHSCSGISRSSLETDRIVVWDDMGRQYEASLVIVSNGGVLMGGLDVDSYGVVHETSFGFKTYQSEPLKATTVDRSLNALHITGVETDDALRPQRNGSGFCRNAFVTGRTLPHWNPAMECSTEGVCVATGWAAAENAHEYLESLNVA